MITAEALRKIVGNDWVVTGKEQTEPYKVDATPPAMMPRAAENVIVVKPATAEEVSSIMKLANIEKTPVYVRGGGTGMAGAAIPTLDGVVISMERFDKIEEIDTRSLMAVAQAGVTLGQLLEAAQGEVYEGYERTVDTHIKNLRQKIERAPRRPEYILTVHGVGYRLRDEA